jgi:hypothetical protein
MWCASRRSDWIKNELINCSVKVTKSIKKVLDEAIQNGVIDVNMKNTEQISKILSALFNEIAFELLMGPSQDIDHRKYWIQVRITLLSILKPQ